MTCRICAAKAEGYGLESRRHPELKVVFAHKQEMHLSASVSHDDTSHWIDASSTPSLPDRLRRYADELEATDDVMREAIAIGLRSTSEEILFELAHPDDS